MEFSNCQLKENPSIMAYMKDKMCNNTTSPCRVWSETSLTQLLRVWCTSNIPSYQHALEMFCRSELLHIPKDGVTNTLGHIHKECYQPSIIGFDHFLRVIQPLHTGSWKNMSNFFNILSLTLHINSLSSLLKQEYI